VFSQRFRHSYKALILKTKKINMLFTSPLYHALISVNLESRRANAMTADMARNVRLVSHAAAIRQPGSSYLHAGHGACYPAQVRANDQHSMK